MHVRILWVIFILSYSDIGVKGATHQPFVIFRPGEFFDPFTEASQDPQISATVTQQPNVFIQPFWSLPTNRAPSYPRTIAGSSGSAEQVDVQIRQPSVFTQLSSSFNNKPKASSARPKGINSPKAFHRGPSSGYPRTVGHKSGNAAQVEAQIRQPSAFAKSFQLKTPDGYHRPKGHTNGNAAQIQPVTQSPLTLEVRAKASENHIKTVNDNLKTLRRLTAETKQGHAPARNYPAEKYSSSRLSNRVAKPNALVAEASGQTRILVGHPSELLAHPSELIAHPSHHTGSRSQGGGESHSSDGHDSYSDKDVEDYKTDHHSDKKEFEKHADHNKKSLHSEKGGHHNEHHDEAGHYQKHHEGKKSHKAAKFGEKKGHKRGHKTKGYHNKFHRDEYHREHRFYDDYNKEGYHEKHGDAHSYHKKKQGGHKKGGGHKSGHSSKKHGKKGHSDKGNVEDEHKGFDREGGRKKYHKHHKDFHKKQGSSRGSKYGHSREH